jgi:glycosyltransferase involved in cell wall biosynthesis
MIRIEHVVVVVPARDEQDRIMRCLESVRSAVRRLGRTGPPVTIVVVADGCTDETVARARSMAGVTVLEQPSRGVGAARAHGVEYGIALAACDPRSVWIANTDADSRVPREWLAHQLRVADSGGDVVVGTVRPDFRDLDELQIRAWTSMHRPGHPNGHVHGANLGVRASAYRAAGGFSATPEHEDVDLVARIATLGFALVPSDEGEVITSGRRQGRTPGGYARYLREDLIARSQVIPISVDQGSG